MKNAARKRVQSQACLSYAEREQYRQSQFAAAFWHAKQWKPVQFFIFHSSFFFFHFFILFLFSCSSESKQTIDSLNAHSYACHYLNIDSTVLYAQKALSLSADYEDGRAEALNNLAFVAMVRMRYAEADSLLQQVADLTDNQIELLVAAVQQMRLCQRRSQNRAFYEWRERAVTAHKRISEERTSLAPRQLSRLLYAESEMAIVTSTYYYYVGLENQSVDALLQMDINEVRRDTAQYLNYLYNIGAGGILTEGSTEQIFDEEMEYLSHCLITAQRNGYTYFEAQAHEALAEHTGSLQEAEEALRLFIQYGDVYQIAGAYRTLASCYHAIGDDQCALDHLHMALADSAIHQAPDLVASIREQLSVAYAAVNDKVQSDANRNIYLDLQEQTRQDQELEARADMLSRALRQLNWMIAAVMATIVLLVVLLWLFNRMNRRQQEDHQLDDLLEEKNEEVAEARLRVERNERRHLEQRAKVSLAMSILPLIDRILYSTNRLDHGQLDYIRELTDNINEQNSLLTQWIQLHQGELNLHIESFELQPLFDIVGRGKTSFDMKGVLLEVQPTETIVKADRVLTLFMLNTLADNARKFTPQGGQVTIRADELTDSVEISISDTGCGMSAEQLEHIFDHKIQQGHGFGLTNCKGIIEKYRKLSQLFSVCRLQAESEQGRGSRFSFRLPKGVMRLWAVGAGLWLMAVVVYASPQLTSADSHRALDQAHIYADSAYFSNINGTYQRTLLFADSCRQCLNDYYLQQHPGGDLLLVRDGDTSLTPTEIYWLHNGVESNYQVILDMRNESAVAALALHKWQLYAYNNKVYTQLFKEMSADSTLADYCRTMQQSQSNKRIAMILLLVLLVMIVPAYYMLYYRHRLHARFRRERQQLVNIELAADELRRADLENQNLHVANAVLDNCLSTLKHETMYYPSRIRQLVDSGDTASLAEVAHYYRDLYGLLIQQATDQVEHIHLHIHPVEFYGQRVLGDANLLGYLFELIMSDNKGEKSANREERIGNGGEKTGEQVYAKPKDERYVVYHVKLASCLSPLTSLLCRQIVRDHGEATNRRGCGITNDSDQIIITLPAAPKL